MKCKLINFAIEGFVLSLLNLGLMVIFNKHHSSYFEVYRRDLISWYLTLAILSFLISFLYMKLKRVVKNKRCVLSIVYTALTTLIDFSFRSYGHISFGSSYVLLWMFIIIIAVWIVFRYEVDELIK